MELLNKKQLLSKERIQIKEKIKGIYFLINSENDEIVYIGQSKNLHARVREHITSEKQFDSYCWIEYDTKSEREYYEGLYIQKYNPRYNIHKPHKEGRFVNKKNGAKQAERAKKNKKNFNKGLINHFHNIMKKNSLKPVFVYYKYLEEAKFYCEQDLIYIADLLGYKTGWVNYKKKELQGTNKWNKWNKS